LVLELEGPMVYLEPGITQLKERLEPADMAVSMARVKAIEAAAKPQQTAPATDAAAPVGAGSKKWTPEKLAELKTYREAHTMPETAVKFGISEQRIRGLLPSETPKAKPFAGLIHRTK